MTRKGKNPMVIIGLTGSIGMGKSTAAKILRAKGLPIYDADKAVHALLKKNGAGFARIARLFPESVKRGAIDRKALGRAAFGHPEKLRQLERILHPLVRKAERTFLQKARVKKVRAVVLEIPLLFETGGENRCDVTLCVSAPRSVQKARVLSRPGMTKEKFQAILSHQMPDAEKREKADFVVPTGGSEVLTAQYLDKILTRIGV